MLDAKLRNKPYAVLFSRVLFVTRILREMVVADDPVIDMPVAFAVSVLPSIVWNLLSLPPSVEISIPIVHPVIVLLRIMQLLVTELGEDASLIPEEKPEIDEKLLTVLYCATGLTVMPTPVPVRLNPFPSRVMTDSLTIRLPVTSPRSLPVEPLKPRLGLVLGIQPVPVKVYVCA